MTGIIRFVEMRKKNTGFITSTPSRRWGLSPDPWAPFLQSSITLNGVSGWAASGERADN